MAPQINRILLYAKDVEKTAAFYERHFDITAEREEGDRIVELLPRDGGVSLMVHRAGKAQKQGQAAVKLVFDVEDVEAFHKNSAEKGLRFGPLHQGDGYVFANAKDPCNNSISISSRAFRHEK
jgi:predicted enzyme related to lactoylglutathione lyase